MTSKGGSKSGFEPKKAGSEEGYVPKKGDIVQRKDDGDIFQIGENTHYKHELELVGLSLERIEAEKKERDKKLIEMLNIGLGKAWKRTDITLADCRVIQEEIRKVFASVDTEEKK